MSAPSIHCHLCGGFLGDPASVLYQPAAGAPDLPVPHSGLCTCAVPTVYGPAPVVALSGALAPPLEAGFHG